jgi:CelD/BcsL family acetyltransferase involved in cellulose biosynthesis
MRNALRRLFGGGFERCPEPIEMGGLRATCQEGSAVSQPIISAWNRLHAAVPTASVFQSASWQRVVLETMCKAGRVRLITVWQGDELVGVLPMCMREDGLLESVGTAVSDYLDPLIDPALEREVWLVALKMLWKLQSRRRLGVTLHNVRDAAPCRGILRELAPTESFSFEEKQVEATPVLALPKSWEDYLATLDAHERKETRRKLNKGLTKGNARAVRCSGDPVEIAQTLYHAFALMEQAPGEKGEAIRKTVRPLLEKAAPVLIREGRMWLTTLYIHDEPAAVTIEFPSASGPQLYNCGFDAAKKEWSPGVVLTSMIIQKAIEGGAWEFDLLRGREPYKYRLGAKDRALWMITLRKL